MSEKSIELDFGPMAYPLAEQLNDQGWALDAVRLKHWQMDADALTRVSIRGYVADATIAKSRDKLFKTIVKAVAADVAAKTKDQK